MVEEKEEDTLLVNVQKACKDETFDLNVIDRILDVGADACTTINWIFNALSTIQSRVETASDYEPYVPYVHRMAKAFHRIYIHQKVPRYELRLGEWRTIVPLYWDFNPETETLVMSDFKINCPFLP